jgi:hypothetical protein
MQSLKPQQSGTLLLIALLIISLTPGSVAAQTDCPYLKQYMAPYELPVDEWPTAMAGPPPGEVEPRLVGPEECRIISDTPIKNAHGVPYRHIIIATSGKVFGYTAKNSLLLPPIGTGIAGEGRENTFADHVFILQARGNMGPFVPGIARYQYSEETPNSMEILIPENPADWNGNLWMLVHGAARFPTLGFFPRKPNQFNRYTEASESAGALMDMGSAVVWTRRDATGNAEVTADKPSNIVLLDDGTELGVPGTTAMGLNNSTALIRDYTLISRNFIEEQLGKRPEATFFRGHSAGAATGRVFLMVKGMNTDFEGVKLYDGFFLDDSAGGRGAPVYFWKAAVVDEIGSFRLEPSETDQLTFDADQMRFMSPVIETVHAAYSGGNTSTVPRIFERVFPTYANYKRENARLNIEKGLGDIWKTYEIADVSHGDATSEAKRHPELAKDMVDMGGINIALEQALVDWVRNGKTPPESRVEARDVWEVDPNVGPAIQLPETACPRGVFRTYMNRPDGTAVGASPALFVPYLTELRPQINANQERPPGFKEEWLEPLNRYGDLVDMTNSGHRMTRPNIEQVWHQRYREGKNTGILKPYEKLTRERYVECVTAVVNELRTDGLLTSEAEKWYIEKAKTDEIGVK